MIILPDTIWDKMLDEFKWPRKAVERVAYLDGIGQSNLEVVTTLVFPDANLQKQYFSVSAEAMTKCAQHFRANGIYRLAQVHTHPGMWVDHSPHDDEMAYSQHDGAISIVLPQHGRSRPDLIDCGILVRGTEGWRRLDANETGRTITIVPGLIDFRRKR
jgi:hypothetical protein